MPVLNPRATILLVEDEEDDVFLMKRALREAGIAHPLRVVSDGDQALDYLAGRGAFQDRTQNPLPGVIFLDLKLPYKTGHEVLSWIRLQEELRTLIVIFLPSAEEPTDIKRAYQLG